jgi:hypothetical protein
MTPPNRDARFVDLEERGGWQKPTEQPSAHARPAGLPPKPGGAQDAGQGQGSQGHSDRGQPQAQNAGQGHDERG